LAALTAFDWEYVVCVCCVVDMCHRHLLGGSCTVLCHIRRSSPIRWSSSSPS